VLIQSAELGGRRWDAVLSGCFSQGAVHLISGAVSHASISDGALVSTPRLCLRAQRAVHRRAGSSQRMSAGEPRRCPIHRAEHVDGVSALRLGVSTRSFVAGAPGHEGSDAFGPVSRPGGRSNIPGPISAIRSGEGAETEATAGERRHVGLHQ